MTKNQILIIFICSVFFIISIRMSYLMGYRKGFKTKIKDVQNLRLKFMADLDKIKHKLMHVNKDHNNPLFGNFDSDIIKLLNMRKTIVKINIPKK